MPRSRWPAIVYCLLSWAGAFYHLILFTFLKRDVAQSVGMSEVTLAWIDGLTFAAAATGGWCLGRLADLGGRRLVLALAPALPALGSWLLASAHEPSSVTLARMVTGFGVGGGWGVGHALLADLYEGRKRLRAAAMLQTGGPLAVIAAAFVGCILVPSGPDGWRSVLTWSAVTAAIALLDPGAMRGTAGSWTAGSWTAGFSGHPVSPPDGPADSPAPLLPSSRTWLRPALFIFGLLCFQMAAYWCTFAWLPSHLLALGFERSKVGWIQMATGFTQGLADLGFGWLSPRVGVRRLFAICTLAFGAGVLVLALAYQRLSADAVALVATICAVGLGSGSWAAFGPLYAEHVPARVRSSVSSLSYHLARATQLVVQPAVAVLGAATLAPTGAALVVGALAAWAGALAIRGLRPPARG